MESLENQKIFQEDINSIEKFLKTKSIAEITSETLSY